MLLFTVQALFLLHFLRKSRMLLRSNRKQLEKNVNGNVGTLKFIQKFGKRKSVVELNF